MLTLVRALSTSLAVYAHNLFWAHMIVHLLMIMVVPVLLAWAQPIRLAHTDGEPRVRAAIDQVLVSRAFQVTTAPPLTRPLWLLDKLQRYAHRPTGRLAHIRRPT
jgi:putative membrane protein